MKRALFAVSILFVGTLAFTTLAATPAVHAATINLSGTWTGTGTDYWENANAADGMIVTWVLTQTGTAVSGTVRTTSLNPNDGTCSSCHRDKTGTLSGTVSGSTLSLAMRFPGHNGEVTSLCTVAFDGTAAAADLSLTMSYTGADSCEGPFTAGSLPLSRQFTDTSLSADTVSIKALHIQELRARIDSVRARYGLSAYSYTDDPLTVGAAAIRAQHIVDLRAALAGVYVAAGRAQPVYSNPVPISGAAIKAAHIVELRAALVAIQ